VVRFLVVLGLLIGTAAARAEDVSLEVERPLDARWTLRVFSGTGGYRACDVGATETNGFRFGFAYDGITGWRMWMAHVAKPWQLQVDAKYDLRYEIDETGTVKTSGIAETINLVSIPLGTDFRALTPFRKGKRVSIYAARETFTIGLGGSGSALAALHDCAIDRVGYQDSSEIESLPASADPFSSSPVGSQSLIDRMIAVLESQPIGKAILQHDPAAETEIRQRLSTAGSSAAVGQLTDIYANELRRFMRERLAQAFYVAPFPAVADVLRHGRDVMRSLKAQPEVCVAFYDSLMTGSMASLPQDIRDSQVLAYAELIVMALKHPTSPPAVIEPSDTEAVLRKAYTASGYSFDGFLELLNQSGATSADSCRYGTEYLSAVASLSDAEAGSIFRKFMAAGLGQTADMNAGTSSGAAPEEQAKPDRSNMDSTVDALMYKYETTRLARLIFRFRPTLRDQVRGRLEALAETGTPEELARNWSATATQVIAPAILALAADAPADVIYPLIQEQLETLRILQRKNPQYCVDYFVGTATVPPEAFPEGFGKRELELKADLVEAAMERPAPISRPVNQEKLTQLIIKAYQKQGTPLTEFAKLARQSSLPADEACKAGIEFTTAIAGLEQEEAAFIHKAMSVIGSEKSL
jgi:hypothetical protein